MGQRKAVTKAIAAHRNHARKALGAALRPTLVRARCGGRSGGRGPRSTGRTCWWRCGSAGWCWVVLGAPTGKRLSPVMADLVATLRRLGELEISDELATQLVARSPARCTVGWRRRAPR